jgi:tetratricopeptide (TPR) repeat protein
VTTATRRRPFLLACCAVIATAAVSSAAETRAQELTTTARQQFLAGEYDLARGALEPLAGGGDVDASLLLARLLVLTGRYREARGLVDGLVTGHPERGDVLVLAGELRLSRGELADAEDLFKKALVADTGSNRARVMLKRVYDLTGRRAESEKIVDYFWDLNNRTFGTRRELDPADFRYIAEAVAGFDAEATKVAFRHYRRAYQRDPDLHEAYVAAGELALEVFDWEKAQRSFDELLKRNPHHPGARLGRARVFLAAARSKEAEAEAEKALSVDPELVGARMVLAQLHLVDDRVAEARGEIDRALAASPRDREALVMDATWRFATGDTAGYRAAVGRALQLYPNDTGVYVGVAEVLEHRRRFPEALKEYRKAIELDAGAWAGHFGAGMTLVRMGEETTGYQALERAFELNAFNVWAYNTLVALDGDFKKGKLAHRETEHFFVKITRTEEDVLGEHVDEVLEQIWAEETKRFGFQPRGPDETKRKVLFEMFADHDDFSARTTGMPNLGALGATLGQIVTMPSPSWGAGMGKPFCWVEVIRHEFAHVITLQLTEYRIPRWFTEGISMLVERDEQVYYDTLMARAAGEGEIATIERLNSLFTRPDKPQDVALGYYQAALIVKHLAAEHGFDAVLAACRLYRDGLDTEQVLRKMTGLASDALDRRIEQYIRAHLDRIGAWAPPGPKELERLTATLAAAPADHAARARRAEALVAAARYDEARVEAQRAITDSAGANATAHVVLGQVQKVRDRDDAAAIESFRKAVAADGRSFFAQLHLGLALAAAGANDEAMRALETAHELNPRFVEPVAAFRAPPLADALRQMLVAAGQTERARAVAERAASVNPNDFAGAAFAATLAFDEGRFEDAAMWLDRSLAINPFDAESQKLFGRVEETLAGRGDIRAHTRRAVRAYRACTVLASRDPEGFKGLARGLWALEQGEQMRAVIERLRQFDATAAERLERELK